jgi:single-strand DNA-binding protein
MSVNKAILIGHVGQDPEINYINEDLPVARFSIATSETFKNKEGNKVTNTEWHNIVVWRGLAKVVEDYVKKGAKLYIEGKITNRQYEKDGQTRYFTEIVANSLQMLDKKGDSPASKNPAKDAPLPTPPPESDSSDDLPF